MKRQVMLWLCTETTSAFELQQILRCVFACCNNINTYVSTFALKGDEVQRANRGYSVHS